MPDGHPFSSYKRWGKIIGGAMKACGLGDPCQPHESKSLISGDLKTAAMKAVYQISYEKHPEHWIPKTEIYQLITANQRYDERLNWFGDLDGEEAKSARTKLGSAITFFEGRWLSGIRLLLDTSDSKSNRWKLRFTKNLA
jgi:hypothetical protein